jgi:hypothetical protein
VLHNRNSGQEREQETADDIFVISVSTIRFLKRGRADPRHRREIHGPSGDRHGPDYGASCDEPRRESRRCHCKGHHDRAQSLQRSLCVIAQIPADRFGDRGSALRQHRNRRTTDVLAPSETNSLTLRSGLRRIAPVAIRITAVAVNRRQSRWFN